MGAFNFLLVKTRFVCFFQSFSKIKFFVFRFVFFSIKFFHFLIELPFKAYFVNWKNSFKSSFQKISCSINVVSISCSINDVSISCSINDVRIFKILSKKSYIQYKYVHYFKLVKQIVLSKRTTVCFTNKWKKEILVCPLYLISFEFSFKINLLQ